MSVFNGSQYLAATIESILAQTEREFEFIIVDDGSTDDSPIVLRNYAMRDSRIRLITQDNRGLTAALNCGCDIADGEILVRQDVGDLSHPKRLQRQLQAFENEKIVAVGTGIRRIGPNDEPLGEHVRNSTPHEITLELINQGTGLVHPASAFRKSAFETVGGYRTEFRYAQDTDLWFRLAGIGLIWEIPETLFDLRIETTGISGQQISKQVELAEIARQCYQRRKRGEGESDLLERASQVSREERTESQRSRKMRDAKASYFIASLLLAQRDARCREYFRRSMCFPNHLVAPIARWMMSFVSCRG